jgi:membrane metallo-endopeptidase-like protein 1
MFEYTAARMLEAMDHEVDRCQDFYNYACGTWNRVHVIPSDRPSYNTFQKMSDDLQAKLKGLMIVPCERFKPGCTNTSLLNRLLKVR